jgi:acyl carrier protein
MEKAIREILRDSLQLGERADGLVLSSPLIGTVAELDSMAVVTVLTMIEEEFDIDIDDEDVSAEIFATVGSLADFVEEKLNE